MGAPVLSLLLLFLAFPAPKDRRFNGQTAAEFQKTFDEMHPNGWRLKFIHGYEQDGASRFTSEWHKPANPPKFLCLHNIVRDHYEQRTGDLYAVGYAEALKSSWKVNGEERLWIVWEKK